MGSRSLAASGGCGSNDSLNCLKFGKKIYFEDVGGGGGGGGGGGSSSRAPAAAPEAAAPAKKGKGVAQGGGQQAPPPRCQVEGCDVDLTGAKAYYCKHKVCGDHSKTPKVIVGGLEQRFCQQCSRFHELPEFDQGKRSCRRRLAGHNERRRKPPPGPMSSYYGRLSSFHGDNSRFRSFLMDFTYPRPSGSDVRAGNLSASNQWQGSLVTPHGMVAAHEPHPYMQGPTSASELPPSQCLAGISDSSCALSLLSTQPWCTPASRNRAQSMPISDSFNGASMAQPVTVSYTNNPWGFKGHGASSSSHEMHHEMGLGHAGDVCGCQFSGELELALQGNRQHPDLGQGRACDHTGHPMHWPL